MKIWSWRTAVAKSELHAHAKLVLYTLSNYMNEFGEGCYPSVDTIAKEASLTKKTVLKYIDQAIVFGYLVKKQHGYRGQRWRRNEYEACYPEFAELQKKGGVPDTLPDKKGGVFHDQKVVYHVHSNTTEEHSNKKYIYKKENNFNEFWLAYPQNGRGKGSKKNALYYYKKALEKTDHKIIMEALTSYTSYIFAKNQFNKDAYGWLKQEGWNDEYNFNEKKGLRNDQSTIYGAAFHGIARDIE